MRRASLTKRTSEKSQQHLQQNSLGWAGFESWTGFRRTDPINKRVQDSRAKPDQTGFETGINRYPWTATKCWRNVRRKFSSSCSSPRRWSTRACQTPRRRQRIWPRQRRRRKRGRARWRPLAAPRIFNLLHRKSFIFSFLFSQPN